MKAAKKHRRKKAKKPEAQIQQPESLTIVRAEPQAIQARHGMPSIKETVQDMEKVRSFIQLSLNRELRVAQERAKLMNKPLTDAQRQKLEIDYGTIPGVDKPFLYQPGAEKICFWLKLKPKFHIQRSELGDGHLEVVASVSIHMKAPPHDEVFEGPAASCTTMESNYRFRWSKREGDEREPNPTEEEAVRLKKLGLGRWRKIDEYVNKRSTGKKIWAWFDRVDNPNIHDERNKVAQIGEKRAFVKAVKNMGALSEIFTTDPAEWRLEDLEDEGDPYTAGDFTATGNTIVDERGFTPSGKAATYDAQRSQAQELGKAKAQEMRQNMTEQPKQAQQSANAAPRPAQKPPRERKCLIQKLSERNEFVVTGHRYDDVQMENFLRDVDAKEALANGDETKTPWHRISDQYLTDFVNVCRTLEIKIDWRG